MLSNDHLSHDWMAEEAAVGCLEGHTDGIIYVVNVLHNESLELGAIAFQYGTQHIPNSV
jgi:hypothetical protein